MSNTDIEALKRENESLKKELSKAVEVRNRALAFILTTHNEEAFKQDIRLTCRPDYPREIEAYIEKWTAHYLKEGEVLNQLNHSNNDK